MWYFTWVLGLGLAVTFAILNGMWHEIHLDDPDAVKAESAPPAAMKPDDQP